MHLFERLLLVGKSVKCVEQIDQLETGAPQFADTSGIGHGERHLRVQFLCGGERLGVDIDAGHRTPAVPTHVIGGTAASAADI